METFKYINREYTPSVDLTTLGKTFDTLEQGHRDAVKAASDLEVAMAQLDLNEKEAEWRQQKINEIRKTIEDNTLYGNSYAALDNIVMKAGNLAADQGMIGRLQAQKDYKDFVKKIETDDTLPQDYKDYFLEKNKYNYKDKFDDKGNIIGGTKWTPTVSPTKIVPLDDIIVKGINIAAKESGGSQITRWIDKKGNVTTDPTQAYDGEVYNTTTCSWERLSREKIWQGINAMIESTPGAKESLAQDYNVAKWRYETKVIENGYKLFETDVTDENGIPLSPQDYIKKRIDPAVYAASYYNSVSKNTYGDGLKTYKAAMGSADAAMSSADRETNPYNLMSSGTPITMEYDYASKLVESKQNTIANLIDLYTKYSGKLPNTGMENYNSEQWLAAIDEIEDPSIKATMRTQLRRFNEANINYTNIEANIVNPSYKTDLDFVTRMINGGKFDSNNELDKKVLNIINNKIFEETGKTLEITIYNDKQYADLINMLDGDTIDGHKKLGIKTGIHANGIKYISINKSNYENIPALAKIFRTVEKRTDYDWFGNGAARPSIRVLDENGNVPTRTSKGTPYLYIRDIDKIISDADNRVKKNISDVAPYQITVSNENLPKQSFTHQLLYYDYTTGKIERADYEKHLNAIDEELTNKLINHQYTQTNMFAVGEDDSFNTLNKIESSKDRQEIGTSIINAIGSKRISISAAHNPIYGNGSNITVWNKSDKDGNPVGIPQRYFIPGLIKDKAAIAFDNDPFTIAADKITIANEVKGTINVTEKYDTPTFGFQQIKALGKNTFKYINNDKEIIINREQAEAIVRNGEKYLQLKDRYISGMYDFDGGSKILDTELGILATELAIILDEDVIGLAVKLENDLNK